MNSTWPFEVPPGREVTSAGGRRFTVSIQRAEPPSLVRKGGDIGRLGPRLQALFHRAEHRMRQHGAWRLLAREGGPDDPPRAPFLDETHPSREAAIERAERLCERLSRAGGS